MDSAIIAFWAACALAGAVIVSSKGGNGITGLLVGGLLGPIGVIITCFMRVDAEAASKQLLAGTRKKCPRCAELVQSEALVCRYCAHEFDQAAQPVKPEAKATSSPDGGISDTYVIWGGIALIVALAVIGAAGMPSPS